MKIERLENEGKKEVIEMEKYVAMKNGEVRRYYPGGGYSVIASFFDPGEARAYAKKENVRRRCLFLFLSGGAVAAAINSMWIGYYQYISTLSTQWAILAVVLGAVAIYIETRGEPKEKR